MYQLFVYQFIYFTEAGFTQVPWHEDYFRYFASQISPLFFLIIAGFPFCFRSGYCLLILHSFQFLLMLLFTLLHCFSFLLNIRLLFTAILHSMWKGSKDKTESEQYLWENLWGDRVHQNTLCFRTSDSLVIPVGGLLLLSALELLRLLQRGFGVKGGRNP